MWYEPLIVALVVVVVVVVLIGPLRRGRVESVERRESAQLAELQAAKEAKYREIRDAELDFRTGKLSQEDHRALDRTLRAEAVQILRRLDRLQAPPPRAGAAADDAAADAERDPVR